LAQTTDTSVLPDSVAWINGLAGIMRLSENRLDPSLKTVISSDVKNGKLALFVPPEMSELQPENLRYVHALASRNQCVLIEDRRTASIRPLVEQRDLKPHLMAKGIVELLKQTGMPGATPKLSQPHRLIPGNPHIDVSALIDMAASMVAKSKHVVVLPTPTLVETTGNETHPISAFACKLVTADTNTVISFFDSPGFKAIGYIANNQFVMHVFVGGGSIKAPLIWANTEAMTKNRFRFQLFRSTQPGQDFGLLYNTFYLDIKQAQEHTAQSASHI